MDVEPTADQKAFARRAVERGRQRLAFLATLDDAQATLARGEGRVITQESMRTLAGQVRERGRSRLMAESDNAQ